MPGDHRQSSIHLPPPMRHFAWHYARQSGVFFDTLAVAAMLHFLTALDDEEIAYWLRAADCVKRGQINWRQAPRWIGAAKRREAAA